MAKSTSLETVLFITLDSCRYDTFAGAEVPHLRSVGELHRAMAPGYFTFSSHAAMFAGFTPGVADRPQSFVNPKFGKLFKLTGGGSEARGTDHLTLTGRTIVDGFKRKGFLTAGTGAVGWFNPATETGRVLTQDFETFYYAGNRWSLAKQIRWITDQMERSERPVFAFINVGETHVPYYHDGAPWSVESNPCVPFSDNNNAAECRRRQRACLEFADSLLAPLLEMARSGTILVCGDHGDCWGEDGLWEHGFYHPKVLEVPLLFRLPASAAQSH
jgi:hypothetical protein